MMGFRLVMLKVRWLVGQPAKWQLHISVPSSRQGAWAGIGHQHPLHLIADAMIIISITILAVIELLGDVPGIILALHMCGFVSFSPVF